MHPDRPGPRPPTSDSSPWGTALTTVDRSPTDADDEPRDVPADPATSLPLGRMLEEIATGVAVAELDGSFDWANPAFRRTVGYTLEELRARDFVSLTHPDDRAENLRLVDELLAGERDSFVLEKRYVTKGGDDAWVRATVSLLHADDGRPTRLVATTEDISAQKAAEARLEENRALMKIAGRVGRVGGWAIDADGSLHWSDEIHELLGYPVGQTPPLPESIDLYLPGSRERVAAALDACVADGTPFDLELHARNARGEEIWARAVGEPQWGPDGTVERVQGAFIDITRRKRAERESQELSELIHKAQDAIVVRDLDHRVTFWNDSAERIFGWTAPEAMGQRVPDLLGVDHEAYRQAHDQLLRDGTWFGEVEKAARDGREQILEARWTLVRDGEGRPEAVLQIDTDITERKRLEEQFLRSQRMESIGTLAGGVAHDLNNALLPVVVSAQMLSEEELTAEGQQLLDIIEGSAQHGSELVKQLLSFARGVDGQRVSIALADLVAEVGRISTDTFPKNIAVHVDIPPDVAPVMGDPTQLRQVLVNLCVNARDVLVDGGTITLSARQERLEVLPGPGQDAPVSGPYVTLTVEDDGPGMSPEVMGKIFDPFFTTKEQGEGTGLGLSTSAVIVESHGGFIEVDSEEGVGSAFMVHLPVDESGAETTAPEATEAPRGSGELVLVVDDEQLVLDTTRLALERLGYRVVTAGDGARAVALLAEHGDEVAIALTDLMMPDMDGAETTRRLRQLRPDLPVVATSGLVTSESSEEAMAAGAGRVLLKPYTTETLATAISEAIAASPTS
jgi:PAS domain S-box-containing protein